MAPYPRHSSIDSALRSKRPVNRTGPLLHRGFGADRKALPIFLVFHPLAARLAPRSNVLRAIVIACLSSVSPEEHALIIPMSATSSGYTESVMLIPQNIRTTTKEFLSALSCIFVIYNYINRYLLKYIYLQKAFSEQLHGIRGSSRDNRLLHILLILTLHKSRFGTLSKNSS